MKTTTQEQGMRLARLERVLLLNKLTRLGVQVIEWDFLQPIEQAIGAKLTRQQHLLQNLRRWAL